MKLLWLLMMIILISAQIEEINQIINGKFLNPGLPPGQDYSSYPESIEGWSCTSYCKIEDCMAISQTYPEVNGASLDCAGYIIDLNSQCISQEITQVLNLSVSNYWLSIDYLYPSQNADQKQMVITFNDEIIFLALPNVQFSIDKYHFQKKIVAKDGINVLKIKNNGLNDCFGFRIANVSLNRQIDGFLQGTMNGLFKSQVLQNSKAIPGGRIFLFSMLSFLVNFDRLQFYLYHNRQYSKNSKNFLQKIKQLQAAKGNFIQVQFMSYFPSFVAFLDNFFSNRQIKKDYISYNIEDEDQRHYSISNSIHYSLTFSVPIVICLFIFLHICFRLLQRWPISKIFRSYAFYATLIFALLQGNIESLTFYSFKELQTFFSFNFQHKLLNLLSVIILFFVFFVSFGLCLWLKFYYQRKTKFLINTDKSTLPSILTTSFDRGMIIFVLGATHQLLLSSPNIQMIALISIELIWFIEKIIVRKQFLHLIFFLVSLLESLIRIYFQTTCLMYSLFQEIKFKINNQYHSYLIYGFMGVIAINFVCNTIFMLINFIISQTIRKNSVMSQDVTKNEKSNNQQFTVVFQAHKLQQNKQQQRKRIMQFKQKNNGYQSKGISTVRMIPKRGKNTLEQRQFKNLKSLKLQNSFVNRNYQSKLSSTKKSKN